MKYRRMVLAVIIIALSFTLLAGCGDSSKPADVDEIIKTYFKAIEDRDSDKLADVWPNEYDGNDTAFFYNLDKSERKAVLEYVIGETEEIEKDAIVDTLTNDYGVDAELAEKTSNLITVDINDLVWILLDEGKTNHENFYFAIGKVDKKWVILSGFTFNNSGKLIYY